MQKQVGKWMADSLRNKLRTEVSVGRINLGFLNRVLIDDIVVKDQDHRLMLKAARTAVTIDILPLLRGNINISTAQLFGVEAHVSRQTPDAPLNCQFIFDRLASNDTTHTAAPHITIATALVRHADITFDVQSEPRHTGRFDLNHLDIHDMALTASFRMPAKDSMTLDVRRFDFTEKNSGLTLRRFSTSLRANAQRAAIDSLQVVVQNSELHTGRLVVDYGNYKKNKTFNAEGSINRAALIPSDFHAFVPALRGVDDSLTITSEHIHVDERNLRIPSLHVHSDKLHLSAQLTANDYPFDGRTIRLQQLHLTATPEALSQYTQHVDIPNHARDVLTRLGSLELQGDAGTSGQDISARLTLSSAAGEVTAEGDYNAEKGLTAQCTSQNLDIGLLTGDERFAKADFELQASNLQLTDSHSAEGMVQGIIHSFDYNGYTYTNITIDTYAENGKYTGGVHVDDENLQLAVNGTFQPASSSAAQTDIDIHAAYINPHALLLTDRFPGESMKFHMSANLQGNNINDTQGNIRLDSASVHTSDASYHLHTLDIVASQTTDGQRYLGIDGDFIHASINGSFTPDQMLGDVCRQLQQYMPALIPGNLTFHQSHFNFDLQLTESDFVHHFVDADYALLRPVQLSGSVNTALNQSFISFRAPRIEYNGTEYDNLSADFTGGHQDFTLQASILRRQERNATLCTLQANGADNVIDTELQWRQVGKLPSSGSLAASTRFARDFGKLSTEVRLKPSELVINDTVWHMHPAQIHVIDNRIACRDVKVSNGDRYLAVNGIFSDQPGDSVEAELNDIQVEYVLNLVNFTAVGFKGHASGHAYISSLHAQPQLSANLRVTDFCLADGNLGTALIHATWDNNIQGVRISSNILDTDQQGADRITTCHGFVSPSNNDIQLQINANHTNAAFLNGFLGSIFHDITGSANGIINIVGPLSDIGITGDVSADVAMTLAATGVRYHVNPDDTIRLRPYRFNFPQIRITDDEGNSGIVNGFVSHKNVKNFSYQFDVTMNRLKAYEEHQFNSDKFMGIVYADGQLSLRGTDGQPLYINVDVTPTRGSMFAYDAATPDAITTSKFITFRDRTATHPDTTTTTLPSTDSLTNVWSNDNLLQAMMSDNVQEQEEYKYEGDIYMDISIHLNNDCEIKLRMDNADDGYISTFGSGNLQAFYHNKGPFTLNGTYNIQSGSYRLYLQDIIYRDLTIHDGSNVVFNGNPFDAGIHLICWYTLNSVPLTDLTSSAAITSNNKVKVNCILDITGHLGDMNFHFDLNLPNVTDETRQLVRSLISTDEEMNTQMIYLLGLGRFYPTEYARATGETTNSQAVNSLLSSTISGQINQMLSNVIGTNSNWNFGTGLSTGEQGWQDLDVEGILSGRLLDDRLLINGNFGYRDNALTQNSSFIGDFDVKWRLTPTSNTYLKAYNKANDRYFTKATLNTQGIGISYQRDFENWRDLFRRRMKGIIKF